MKKLTSFFIALVIILVVFSGCGSQTVTDTPQNGTLIHLGGLKGPTSIGMVKLLDDAEKNKTENTYDFTMAGSADELTPKLLKGELDIIAAPANLGSVLYNKSGGAVKMIAVNTLGVIYVVENGGNEIRTLSDLKGKTVYATGKGSTPEYALNYLLSRSGLVFGEDVTVEWRSEPTEVVAKMATEDHSVAILPQPYVTVAQNQLADLHIAIDLNKEWEKLDNGSAFITAGLIVRTEFAEEHPDAVNKFLREYAESTKYVNENTEAAAVLVEKYGIVKASVAEKAIPYCNIVCITGNEMRSALKGYFEILCQQNKSSVGGELPEDDFYWNYEK